MSFMCTSVNTIVCVLSHVQLCVMLWTIACQVPLSMGFLRQEYWSGLPFPSPADLPDPGIEPKCPSPAAMQADSLPLSPYTRVCLPPKNLVSIHYHTVMPFTNFAPLPNPFPSGNH